MRTILSLFLRAILFADEEVEKAADAASRALQRWVPTSRYELMAISCELVIGATIFSGIWSLTEAAGALSTGALIMVGAIAVAPYALMTYVFMGRAKMFRQVSKEFESGRLQLMPLGARPEVRVFRVAALFIIGIVVLWAAGWSGTPSLVGTIPFMYLPTCSDSDRGKRKTTLGHATAKANSSH